MGVLQQIAADGKGNWSKTGVNMTWKTRIDSVWESFSFTHQSSLGGVMADIGLYWKDLI